MLASANIHIYKYAASGAKKKGIFSVYDTVFQTKTGKEICRLMFGI